MPVVPSENTAWPPAWGPADSFQFGFETNETLTTAIIWTTVANVTTATTGGAAEGDYYGVIAANGYLRKYINTSAVVVVRFAFRFGARTTNREIFQIDYGATPTALGALTYTYATDMISDSFSGRSWARQGDFQTMEYQFNIKDQAVYVWCDGTYLGTAAIADVSAEYIRIAFGDGGTQNSILHLDAVKVTAYRSGLPGQVNANATEHTRVGDVELDGRAYAIFNKQLQEQDISGFAPRLGAGDPSYSDLSGFQHFLIPSGHHGIGQTDMLGTGQGDENAYLIGTQMDTHDAGVIRLANNPSAVRTSALAAYASMPNGEVYSVSMEGDTVWGVRFGSKATAGSYNCLFKVNNSTGAVTAKAFTCEYGVTGLLYDGAYLYVSVGGTSDGSTECSMYKIAKAANWATGGSWTAVGDTDSPPTDMSHMEVYAGQVWVSKRAIPVLTRGAKAGLEDLAFIGLNDTGAYDFETRVGPGSVPITGMRAFAGTLYVGREDGLYAVTYDIDMPYVQVIETTEPSIWNYRSMVVHSNYLIYAIGRHVYRWAGGQTKQEITPGYAERINNQGYQATLPYANIDHWESFHVSNDILYAVGYDTSGTGYVYSYNGSGWCRLYSTGNLYSTTEYPAGLAVTPDSADEPQIHYAAAVQTGASAGAFNAYMVSARMGIEAPDTAAEYVSSGNLTTSYMAFGLPMVPKLFRMVRLEVEGASVACPIKVEYYVWTGQEEKSGTLGVMTQHDANFLMFPAGTLGLKLKLKFTMTRASGASPVIKRIVVQYLDRPEPVWGYNLAIDLSRSVFTNAAKPNPAYYEEMKRHLRQIRSTESYIRFVDMDGNYSDVLVSSGPVFRYVNNAPVAQLTLMVVKRYEWTPGAEGVATSAT